MVLHRAVSGRRLALIAALGLALAGLGEGACAERAQAKTSALCRPASYLLQVQSWSTKRGTLVAVGILVGKTQPCVVAGTVRLAIRADGHMIGGGPVALHLSTPVGAWSQLVRTWTWRNWCGGHIRAEITATFNGKKASDGARGLPLCPSRSRSSTIVTEPKGIALVPFTGDRIPAHLLPSGTPVPVSEALIHVTNSWLVSDGRTLVAVYAGAVGETSRGAFAIVRQNLVFGVQDIQLVETHETGATTITRAPEGSRVEVAAQRGAVEFSDATGGGVLRLADDSIQR